MANRLLAYRVALEIETRTHLLRRRGRAPRLADISERLLRCLVSMDRAGGDEAAALEAIDDYELATRARVSVRQTRELYEEIGMGLLVREALDGLCERDLIRIVRRPASGHYRGIFPTEQGRASVDLRPWYRRWLAFFDAPERARLAR